jgi:hypothetical protein
MKTREAYRLGRAAQRRAPDWDVSLGRFSDRHCQSHVAYIMCYLESAWCDGWDDMQENNRDREPE